MRFAVACTLALTIAASGASAQKPPAQSPEALMGAAVHQQEVEGDPQEAIAAYKKVVDDGRASRALKATALFRLGECYEALGQLEARKAYDQLLREYTDQTDIVAKARGRLARLNAAAAPPPAAGIVAREVWDGAGYGFSIPSADGRILAFVNQGRLTVRDIATGRDSAISLAGGYAAYGSTVVTPDGRRIIYTWREAGGGESVRIVDVDGRNARTILPASPVDSETGFFWPVPLAVSPDGQTVAVGARERATNDLVIALASIATGKVVVLQRSKQGSAIGGFSPDGKYLTYARGSADREVRLAAVDGSSDVLLVGPRGMHRRPVFTPDGTQVVFASNRVAGRWDLWSVKVAGGRAAGAPEMIKPDIGSVVCLGFSQDGTLYYAQSTSTENAYVVDIDPATGKAKSTPKRISEKFVHSSFGPIWSPDGKSVAFAAHPQSGADDASLIVIRSIATGEERDFTVPYANPSSARYNRWFPDGKSLLLTDNGEKGRVFRRLDVATGKVTPLFEALPLATLRTFIERDGGAVFYTNREQITRTNGTVTLTTHWTRHDLKTGEEHSVFDTPGFPINPSPDGRSLVYLETSVGPTMFVSLADRQPRALAVLKGYSDQGGGAGWTPDSRGLFLAPAIQSQPDTPVDPIDVWYMPLDGGQPYRIGVSMQILNSLSTSLDGTQLGFSGTTTTTRISSLQGLFTPPRRSAK
jgi:Tol biopolymer transport system component